MAGFRTKSGRCVLDEENIYVLESIKGLLRRYGEAGLFGKYMVLSHLIVFGWAVYLLVEGPRIWIYGGVAAYASLFAFNRFRGFTSRESIPLDSVNRVKALEGSKGFTRPRFIVEFEESGAVKKRYVMTPSRLLDYGDSEFEKAKRVFEEKGIEME